MTSTSLCIREFYDGKSVFITGATGLAGKSLVERLLDTVNVSKIYVLMRGKKGKSFEERLQGYLNDECFSYFDADKVDKLKSKIVAVEGDITHPRLGLSDHDFNMIVENVQVVFHAAASVRFQEAYKTALRLHIFGTNQVLQLCREIKKLEVLVHLSSISCWFVRDKLSERIYMSGLDPLKLWKDVEDMSEEEAEVEGKDYLGEWPKYPNSYIFTKTMVEVLLHYHAKDLKVVCARLPFIGSAYKRPTPGWFEAVQTINAIVICIATGTIRTLAFEPDTKPEFLPVDYCSNALITTAVEVATGDDNIKVYNVTPRPSEIPTIHDAHQFAYRLGKECPRYVVRLAVYFPDSLIDCWLKCSTTAAAVRAAEAQAYVFGVLHLRLFKLPLRAAGGRVAVHHWPKAVHVQTVAKNQPRSRIYLNRVAQNAHHSRVAQHGQAVRTADGRRAAAVLLRPEEDRLV